MCAILVSFVKPSFWRTRVNEMGFEIEKLRGPTVTIPWSRIQCLDLSGLKAHPRLPAYFPELSRTELERLSRRRSLRVMTDGDLVRAACDGAFDKIVYAASNVLSLEDIVEESTERLCDGLAKLATAHSVRLDGIWLPDP
jgi:hypothetical protein